MQEIISQNEKCEEETTAMFQGNVSEKNITLVYVKIIIKYILLITLLPSITSTKAIYGL